MSKWYGEMDEDNVESGHDDNGREYYHYCARDRITTGEKE